MHGLASPFFEFGALLVRTGLGDDRVIRAGTFVDKLRSLKIEPAVPVSARTRLRAFRGLRSQRYDIAYTICVYAMHSSYTTPTTTTTTTIHFFHSSHVEPQEFVRQVRGKKLHKGGEEGHAAYWTEGPIGCFGPRAGPAIVAKGRA